MADPTTSGAGPPAAAISAGAGPASGKPPSGGIPKATPSGKARSSFVQRVLSLRAGLPPWAAVLCGALCIVCVYGLWWFVTRGEAEERILSPSKLPSPSETFATFHALWYERKLASNLWASLERVCLGFSLAVVVGVPIGVLCGCFSWAHAFFSPLTIFGRNIPVAALVPLTFALFGIGEAQKVMFIFIACVAFIASDTAHAIADVGTQYIDTAYTLGGNLRQVVLKVLFPLALPAIFNSLRMLFGLAFGYIMLAELVKFGGESGGLGDIIITSQRRGPREHVYLVLMIIPLVALAIDRVLYWIQRELFPYRYGGRGLLHSLTRVSMHGWEDLMSMFFESTAPALPTAPQPHGPASPPGSKTSTAAITPGGTTNPGDFKS